MQPGEPYVSGGWDYLVPVLAIIKKYNMNAIIDLHGAPGSQVILLFNVAAFSKVFNFKLLLRPLLHAAFFIHSFIHSNGEAGFF